jgi:hypothetical protein
MILVSAPVLQIRVHQPNTDESPHQATFLNTRTPRVVLHCDCDEEARPRAGYRPGAPGGCQVEHVDEHLRAAARMGASPFPSVRPRVANLHAGCGPHSRDRSCRDRAHCTTSQPRLKQVSRYIPEHSRTRVFGGQRCCAKKPIPPNDHQRDTGNEEEREKPSASPRVALSTG